MSSRPVDTHTLPSLLRRSRGRRASYKGVTAARGAVEAIEGSTDTANMQRGRQYASESCSGFVQIEPGNNSARPGPGADRTIVSGWQLIRVYQMAGDSTTEILVARSQINPYVVTLRQLHRDGARTVTVARARHRLP